MSGRETGSSGSTAALVTSHPGVDLGPVLLSACIISMGLATVFAAARFYCRMQKARKLFLDDYLILSSVLWGWISIVFIVAAVQAGLGRDMGGLTVEQKSQMVLWTIAGFFPSIMTFTVPKFAVMSLLCQLLMPSRLHKRIMVAAAALLMFNALACLALILSRCRPFQSLWDFTYTGEKKCFDVWYSIDFAVWTTAFCAAVDLWLSVWPAWVLSGLQINIKKKIALSIALGIGSISVAVSCYKATKLKALASPNFSFDSATLNIWTIVEGSVVIIAASIPLLRPLVDQIFGRRAIGSDGSYGRSTAAGGATGGFSKIGPPAKSDHMQSYELKNSANAAPRGTYNSSSTISSSNSNYNNNSSRNNNNNINNNTRSDGNVTAWIEDDDEDDDDNDNDNNNNNNNITRLGPARVNGGGGRLEQQRQRDGMGIERTTEITVSYSRYSRDPAAARGVNGARPTRMEWV